MGSITSWGRGSRRCWFSRVRSRVPPPRISRRTWTSAKSPSSRSRHCMRTAPGQRRVWGRHDRVTRGERPCRGSPTPPGSAGPSAAKGRTSSRGTFRLTAKAATRSWVRVPTLAARPRSEPARRWRDSLRNRTQGVWGGRLLDFLELKKAARGPFPGKIPRPHRNCGHSKVSFPKTGAEAKVAIHSPRSIAASAFRRARSIPPGGRESPSPRSRSRESNSSSGRGKSDSRAIASRCNSGPDRGGRTPPIS
ncbi:MAG: hypothetical protein BWY88_00758 [Synergistetes bacterium ADurb.Bin520]|nr:MAG: hypothetical protein BWY88_00758 [Synergistetes bacterium ADurb.Bin520]